MLCERVELVDKVKTEMGLATGSITEWVSGLNHEGFDDAVEDVVVVFSRFGESWV
jgi:hypothetical protein